jgi:threonylcarbamoyladenosine tRNA methylthiotransferase MtaB
VLRLMRRKYRVARFIERIEAVRARWDRPAISTDVIVGFPGETERDFLDTLDVCGRAGFMKVHVFPYSARGGTAAPDLPDQVSPADREARKQRLLAWDAEHGAAWRQSFVGERLEVLVESRRDEATGLLTGLTERYLRVLFSGPDRLMGQIVDVHAEAQRGAALCGTRLPVLESVS